MATITTTFERCQADNLGISKNLLRQLVKSGEIPSILVGKSTRLINYDLLLKYLNGEATIRETHQRHDDISRVSENLYDKNLKG